MFREDFENGENIPTTVKERYRDFENPWSSMDGRTIK